MATQPTGHPYELELVKDFVEFIDTPITDPAELAKLNKIYRRPGPRRPRVWWLAGGTAVAAALLVGFFSGRFLLPGSNRGGHEVLLAGLTPQPGLPRAGKPQEKILLDQRGVYQLKEGDFKLKLHSPRAGYATIVFLSPDQVKVYPGPQQDQIEIAPFQTREYGPLHVPGEKTTVLLFVTEKPAAADIAKMPPDQNVDRFVKAAQENLWQAGHRWLALDQFTIEHIETTAK